MNTIGVALVTGLMALLSHILGRYLERRKQAAAAEKTEAEAAKIRAEADGKEIENAGKIAEMWQRMAGELEKKVDMLNSQVFSLTEQNKTLLIKIAHLEKTIERNNS